MKMGLTVILIGHVNFMLAALVQGVVLRHINFQKHHRTLEYAISTVVTLTAGLLGILVGILTIVLAKNRKSRCLTWTVFVLSLTAAILAGISALGLFIAVVMAIKQNGRILLSHCRFPDAIGYSSITNECPFDPTRIYSTTLILWVPLIVTSVVQMVFTSRCFGVCLFFLGLPCCCCCRRSSKTLGRSINAVTPLAPEPALRPLPQISTSLPSSRLPSQRRSTSTTSPPLEPAPLGRISQTPSHRSAPGLVLYTESPVRLSSNRSHSSEPDGTSRPRRDGSKAQSRSLPPPRYAPRPQPYSSAGSSERPLSSLVKAQDRTQLPAPSPRTRQRPEEHQLLGRPRQPLQRGAMERTSFWI
ncbi:unnamed protein product [Knipowitschia caucasica]